MKLFLDSSAIIDLMVNKPNVVDVITNADEVYTSSLCAYELILGERIRKEKGLPSNYESVVTFFEIMATMPFTYSDAINAAIIMAKLTTKGKKVGEIDVLIAAQALDKDATVLTKDKHFGFISEETGLKVEKIA